MRQNHEISLTLNISILPTYFKVGLEADIVVVVVSTKYFSGYEDASAVAEGNVPYYLSGCYRDCSISVGI